MRIAPVSCTTRDGRSYVVRAPEWNEIGAVLDHAWELHSTEPEVQIGDPDEFQLTVRHLEGILRRMDSEKNSLFLAAFEQGDVLGTLSVSGHRMRKIRHVAELGITVRRAWRRQGVARTLLQIAIHAARREGVLRRLTLSVFSSNEGAIRLYEQLGFVLEGLRRGQVRLGDRYVDELTMALEL